MVILIFYLSVRPELYSLGTCLASLILKTIRNNGNTWEALYDLLHPMVEDGLHSSNFQVRHTVVECLILLDIVGPHAIHAMLLARGQEKEKDVLDVMAKFFAKYGETFEGFPQIFYFDVDFGYYYYSEDEFSGDDFTSRRKQGGYSKSHVSRSARHRKKHGMESSQAPSAFAREKKWKRSEKPLKPEIQSFASSKQKFQREKEQDWTWHVSRYK